MLPGYTNQTSFDYVISGNDFEANATAIRAHKTEQTLALENTFAYNYTDFFIEEQAENDTLSGNVFGNAVNSCINNQSTYDIFARGNIMSDGITYHGYAIRSKDYLYVEWKKEESGELAATELYDLQEDPGENRNVVNEPAYAEAAKEMAQRLDAGWGAALPESRKEN